MSPCNQGVFQLLKEVTFRGILVFCNSLRHQQFHQALTAFFLCPKDSHGLWTVALEHTGHGEKR